MQSQFFPPPEHQLAMTN